MVVTAPAAALCSRLGAVWVGFPVLRQCFNDVLGWTQTTNNPWSPPRLHACCAHLFLRGPQFS